MVAFTRHAFVSVCVGVFCRYGQTNCFVLPDGNYGVFEVNDTEYYVCSARSART
jgi:hypothetical protein